MSRFRLGFGGRRQAETHLHPATAMRLSQALVDMAEAFDEWIVEAVRTLIRARDTYVDGPATPQARRVLREAAHQLVWEAESLGQPDVARVARSLEKLLERAPADAVPHAVIDAHMQALELALANNRHRGRLAGCAGNLDRATDACLAALESAANR